MNKVDIVHHMSQHNTFKNMKGYKGKYGYIFGVCMHHFMWVYNQMAHNSRYLIGGDFLLSGRRTTHIEDVHANDLLNDIGTQDLGPLGL
jgi:hypothetical protein